MTDFHSSNKARDRFWAKCEQIRNSPEQIALQKKAAHKAIQSNLVGVFLAVTLVSLVISIYIHAHWLVSLTTGGFTLIFYFMIHRLMRESFILAKEQDRRYVMDCFRAAKNIDEMNWAGWFQYFPEMEVKIGFDQKRSDEIGFKEIQRMRQVFSQKSSFEERLAPDDDSIS